MRFKRFELRNFKGATDVTLELEVPQEGLSFTTLVGLNESGKTTILSGIDLFDPGTPGTSSKPKHLGSWENPSPELLIPLSQAANFNGRVSVGATLSLDDEDVAQVRKTVEKSTSHRILEIPSEIEVSTSWNFKDSKHEDVEYLWPNDLGRAVKKTGSVERVINSEHKDTAELWQKVSNAMLARMPSVWFFPNTLFDFPETIQLVQMKGESRANRLYRELFADLLAAVNPTMNVQDHVISRVLSDDEAAERALKGVEAGLNAELQKNVLSKWEEIFDKGSLGKKQVMVHLAPTKNNASPEVAGVDLQINLVEGTSSYLISERSQGFKWFFVYLLLTSYRGRSRRSAKTLFLFDEPATNLHPAAQERLLHSLGDLARTAQVVYTTHSPHLINPDWLGTTYVVTNDSFDPLTVSADAGGAGTNIRVAKYKTFANAHPTQLHYFQPILDVLEFKPSRLDLVRPVVMVEGKSDYYFFRYYADVERRADAADIPFSFLPGGGAGSLDAVIQLYLAWARPFVVLLDSDGGGKDQTKRYREKFGPVMDRHLFHLGEVSQNNAKEIEDVLHANDRVKVCKLVGHASFNKKRFREGLEIGTATQEAAGYTATSRKAIEVILSKLATALDAQQ